MRTKGMKVALAAIGLSAAALLVSSAPSSAGEGGNERVSVTSVGEQLTGSSTTLLDLTPSGQHVVMASDAPELGVTSGRGVFVRDRLADTTTRIDSLVDGAPSKAVISDDGRYVAYASDSVYRLHDRTLGSTIVMGTGLSTVPLAMSGDGSTVAYTLSNGNTYARDTSSGTVTTVGGGHVHAMSASGRYLLWKPTTTSSIVRLDRQTNTTTVVSTTLAGQPTSATAADLSADGTKAVFQTSDLIFLWSATGPVVQASVQAAWEPGVRLFSFPAISADGSTVSYTSRRSTSSTDAYPVLRPLGGSAVEAAAVRIDGSRAAGQAPMPTRLSQDGRFVAYTAQDGGLVNGDTNGVDDVFVTDRVGDLAGAGAGTITGVVDELAGTPLDGVLVTASGPRGTFTTFSAPDGSYSFAPLPSGRWTIRFTAGGFTDRFYADAATEDDARSVFVEDGEAVTLQTVTLVPRETRPASIVNRTDVLADADAIGGSISADGRYVAFASAASNLVPEDTNGVADVFVADRETGQITRVSVTATGDQLSVPSSGGELSSDGRHVVFTTAANGVVPSDGDGQVDAFVTDLDAGTSTRATFTVNATVRRPNLGAAQISGDGTHVGYRTATDFVVGRVDGTGTPMALVHRAVDSCPANENVF